MRFLLVPIVAFLLSGCDEEGKAAVVQSDKGRLIAKVDTSVEPPSVSRSRSSSRGSGTAESSGEEDSGDEQPDPDDDDGNLRSIRSQHASRASLDDGPSLAQSVQDRLCIGSKPCTLHIVQAVAALDESYSETLVAFLRACDDVFKRPSSQPPPARKLLDMTLGAELLSIIHTHDLEKAHLTSLIAQIGHLTDIIKGSSSNALISKLSELDEPELGKPALKRMEQMLDMKLQQRTADAVKSVAEAAVRSASGHSPERPELMKSLATAITNVHLEVTLGKDNAVPGVARFASPALITALNTIASRLSALSPSADGADSAVGPDEDEEEESVDQKEDSEDEEEE